MIIVDKTYKTVYTYDAETGKVFKDNMYMNSDEIEPVFSGIDNDEGPIPIGLWIKNSNIVLIASGNRKQLTDINSIK